eukprot:jgi/Mesvir1/23406/Mv21098-RA.1
MDEVVDMEVDGPHEVDKSVLQRRLADLHRELVDRGFSPNDAAQLAIVWVNETLRNRDAADAKPLDVTSFLASLSAARKGAGDWQVLEKQLRSTLSSSVMLLASFARKCELCDMGQMRTGQTWLDFEAIESFFDAIAAASRAPLTEAVMQPLAALVGHLATLSARQWDSKSPVFLWQILFLLENQLLMEPSSHDDLLALMRLVVSLPPNGLDWFGDAMASYPPPRLLRIVLLAQHYVTIGLYKSEGESVHPSIATALQFLALLFKANNRGPRPKLDISVFYNDAVNNEDFGILEDDYNKWRRSGSSCFSFCSYPFVYNPASKRDILQLEHLDRMEQEFTGALIRSLFERTCPFFVLKVRRDHLVQDAIVQIQRRGDEVKKPLKVQFVGEEGVDEGGVKKEFFQLIVRSIFDPKYGMFSYDEDTRNFWFNAWSDDLSEFELIGTMIGLAIYNKVILDFRFPLLIYKKLLGETPTFDDLKEVAPVLGKGLEDLLSFKGDVESVFCRHFEISYDRFGEVVNFELKEGGSGIPVTNDNRQEYVDLYTQFYLGSIIEKQFSAFARGFQKLCGGAALQLFRPEELEQVVCGSPVLDFEDFEKQTAYENGYSRDSPTIVSFWEIVHSFSDDEKRKLLFFATGSDRAPIKGLASLPFVISRNGGDSDRLPTAHTCFNHLLLPQYKSKEKLRERLVTAINNAEGFGLM